MFNEVYEKRRIRSVYSPVINWAKSLPESTILKRKSEAENLFKKIGITFSVYNNYDTSERLIPFDMFLRILSKMSTVHHMLTAAAAAGTAAAPSGVCLSIHQSYKKLYAFMLSLLRSIKENCIL